MACKVVNLIACIIYLIALFFILFSFEPKKMGGIYKLKKGPKMDWSGKAYKYPGEILIHPFYISWTSTGADGKFEDKEPTEKQCLERFGPTEPSGFGQAKKTSGHSVAKNFYDQDGLLDKDSKLPCIVSIANAASRSKFAQRRYSNYVFGAAWEYDEASKKYRTKSYGPRAFHKDDYGFTPEVNKYDGTGGKQLPEQYNQLTPNVWATQDAVFGLCQASGFFLAVGIAFHVIAFLMGGFIWNYAKCCCDFGICGFIFNSIIWSSMSLVCYLISLCAFAGIFFQGVKPEEPPTDTNKWMAWDMKEDDRLELVWSVGGALIITGMVFTAIAISLASYQWAKDRQEADEDKMEAAVEQAVRRVSGQGI